MVVKKRKGAEHTGMSHAERAAEVWDALGGAMRVSLTGQLALRLLWYYAQLPLAVAAATTVAVALWTLMGVLLCLRCAPMSGRMRIKRSLRMVGSLLHPRCCAVVVIAAALCAAVIYAPQSRGVAVAVSALLCAAVCAMEVGDGFGAAGRRLKAYVTWASAKRFALHALQFLAAAGGLFVVGLGSLIAVLRLLPDAERARVLYWYALGRLGAAYWAAVWSGAVVWFCAFFSPKRPRGLEGRRHGAMLRVVVLVALCAVAVGSGRSGDAVVIAHRGGGLYAPENTIAALELAVKSGAEYAEIDVRETKDGALVLMHDASLARTAGVKEKVKARTLAELAEVEAGASFAPRFRGEPIPTLQQALDCVHGKLILMIELKEAGLEARTVRAVRQAGMAKTSVIASMDYQVLREVRRLAPEIKTCFIVSLLGGSPHTLRAADQLSMRSDFVTRRTITMAHRAKKEVFVWTLNRPGGVRRALRLGADGVVSDDPYLTRYLIEGKGKRDWTIWLFDAVFGEKSGEL